MRLIRFASPMIAILLAIGLIGTAAAGPPEYAIGTAFTEMGASTWHPSMVVIDTEKYGKGSSVVLRVTNASGEDFSFVVEKLGIKERIPAGTDRAIHLALKETGIYKFYSDLHASTTAQVTLPGPRPHVPGWLVIGSMERSRELYLDIARNFTTTLLEDLKTLKHESVHFNVRPALIESCDLSVGKLQWATEELWLVAQSLPDPPVNYSMIHSIVNEDIAPTFRKLKWPMNVTPEAQEALMDQLMTKLSKVKHLISVVRPVSTN